VGGVALPKGYSSKEIIKRLLNDGWYFAEQKGSHRHYRHPVKPGKVTVPHPSKHISIGVLKSVEKQSGLKF